MKGEIGSLIFIKDEHDSEKRRPHICVAVFKNNAGVPYNWWVIPITSKSTIGIDNLVEVKHQKLKMVSYAKINDLHSIKWEESYETSKKKFAKKYTMEIINKICMFINPIK